MTTFAKYRVPTQSLQSEDQRHQEQEGDPMTEAFTKQPTLAELKVAARVIPFLNQAKPAFCFWRKRRLLQRVFNHLPFSVMV